MQCLRYLSDIWVKIFPPVILLTVKLVNILSMTVDDWLETLVGWVIQGTKLLERKVLMKYRPCQYHY